MFKNVPGNSEFQIALNGKIVSKEIEGCTPVISENKVNIEMFGKSRLVNIKWLALISHYDVRLPEEHKDKIWNIDFVYYDSSLTRSIASKIMVFNKPIIFDKDFRIIPNFTRYAITKEGKVYDLFTDRVIKISYSSIYPSVYIYNPDRNDFRNVPLHRLVVLAWVINDNYFEKPLVNHIDGNKINFYYKNLEWVSYKENSDHAVATGLRNDNMNCKIYDVVDRKEITFYSIKQACNFMGIRDDIKLNTLLYKTKNRLISDRYELKLADDDTPWFYTDKQIGAKAGRYLLIVTSSDGSITEYPDLLTFKRLFKIWNISNINDLVNKFKVMYPEMKIEVKDNYTVLPVQAYNLQTKEIIESAGIRQMSRLINRDFNAIRLALIKGETRTHQDYAFRYKTNRPWDTNFAEYICSPKCILATHKNTNEVMSFSSLRKIAEHFNVTRDAIKRFLRTGNYFRLWKLTETGI